MNIIAVDDERHALSDLKAAVEEALADIPQKMFCCFDEAVPALEHAKANQTDIAFLDINMSGINGLQLAKNLKDIYGKTNIIFVTGYHQYAMDAMALKASGYIMKPVTVQAVREEIEELRHPIALPAARIRVRTFGNFEVFANEKPLTFTRSKTKELFAYLIYRDGALCTNNEIVAILWEHKEDSRNLQSHFRKLVFDLNKTLKEAGMGDIIIRKHGSLAIIPEKISCDLYDFCKGRYVNNYSGEFMAQYSWAEFNIPKVSL